MSNAVEINGNVYEVGKYYWFYDDNISDGVLDRFVRIDGHLFESENWLYLNCAEFKDALESGFVITGAITLAEQKEQ